MLSVGETAAKLLQDTGLLSLDEIGAVVREPGRGGDWRAAVHARLAVIRARWSGLASAEEFLTHLLICSSDDPVAQRLPAPGDAMEQTPPVRGG